METGYLMPRVKRRVFDNGLIVLTEKIPKAGIVLVILGIKVGLAEENKELNGARHFIEHLGFKGNEYRTRREIIRSMEWSGSIVNAGTGDEEIIFWAETIPSGVSNILKLFYQMATNFRHNPQEFLSEREVVLGEIRSDIENPQKYFIDGLFVPKILKGTPFAVLIEGTVNSISNLTQERLEEFKRLYFVPNLEVIIVVGEFNEKKVINTINSTFGKQEFQNIVLSDHSLDLTNRHIEVYEERKSIENAYMCLGYKVPTSSHSDAHKLKLLTAILGGSMSSRLFEELRDEKGIGYNVGADIHNLSKIAVLYIYVADFDPARLSEAKEIILKEFYNLKTVLVSDEELQGVKKYLIFIHEKEKADLKIWGEKILAKEFENIPYNMKEFPSHIEQVSKEDIMEAANKYLTDEYTFAALVPEGFKPF